MQKVDINYVKWLRDEMDKINKLPFNEIDWYDGTQQLDIPQATKDEWKFVGMTNCSFVETGFYEENACQPHDLPIANS